LRELGSVLGSVEVGPVFDRVASDCGDSKIWSSVTKGAFTSDYNIDLLYKVCNNDMIIPRMTAMY
jgi:hypothetical protein